MSEGALLVENTPFVLKKYRELTDKNLARRVELVCQFHDEGKELSERWQTACQKDYETFLQWRKQNHNLTFKDYSLKADAGKNIRHAGVRHEFHSLKKNSTLPIMLQAAVAAHHGKLCEDDEERWMEEGFADYWDKFKQESYQEMTLEQVAKRHYEYAGPRGLLQLADHRASAKEDGDFVPNITAFSYTFPHPDKRGVQRLVEAHWQDALLLVRAPTGAGKTDAALLWASLQISNQRAERLIIAMPTRFTSNALAVNVSENLSDTGLYHSSAWFAKFQGQVETGHIRKNDADKIHEFARLLQTPVTVCTIDHLLMSLTLSREDQHLIAFNLANSCLVIDEADFYDDFTQANIASLLKILYFWKVPVLLMSASLPESVVPVYQQTGYAVDKIFEDTSDYQRIRFEIKEIRNYSAVAELEDLLYKCIEVGTAIIYANTVDKAVAFYDWFDGQGVKSILYHSRYTEPDKLRKEEQLIEALGKEAWNNNVARGIAIMTQIGEMSINISADIMISELCPIDRLTQRAGRLCRFDKTKTGQMFVVVPFKDGEIYPAPYGKYDRASKSWNACEAFSKTMEAITLQGYNAELLVNMLNKIYDTQESSAQALNNARILQDSFCYNWLINPKASVDKDDDCTNFWKSRNMEPNDTVLVEKPPTGYFRNYLDFQSWKIKNSLDLPVYLIQKAHKLHLIDYYDIKYQDRSERIPVIRYGFYSLEKGFVINNVEDNFL
jgi:CRISPR-associated endonuclease/helicase Cas3